MLIVYFFPSFVPQSSGLKVPWQKVEKNAAAGGWGGTFTRLARGRWHRTGESELVSPRCQCGWCFTADGAGTGQPHPDT